MTRYDIKQIIVVRKDLNMRKGKMCAQVAHASMKFIVDTLKTVNSLNSEISFCEEGLELTTCDSIFNKEEKHWLFGDKFAKIVVYVDSEQELLDLIELAETKKIRTCPIIDSGNTEFHGVPTLTCAAFGPDKKSKLDKLTGHLKLL